MGLEFGHLPVHIRRIAYYTLSPYEQKLWVNFFSTDIPNLFRRAIYVAPRIAPGLLLSAFVYTWTPAEHKRLNRKDPKLYENDK
ncbi:cytochrome b-c1 complex subunit 8-like [Cephus cinctus]|uniref:Cytochrome b-c1 complex subunit 8 n=1 Tax=Cephus cinctus TaxID=211228 RepID=A0AAJ7BUX0_CEPCN|nr:cytochrome b-c1 complex subunit 8-like [Cephus cinctus]